MSIRHIRKKVDRESGGEPTGNSKDRRGVRRNYRQHRKTLRPTRMVIKWDA